MKTTVNELSDLKIKLAAARQEHLRLYQEANRVLGYVVEEPGFESSLKLHSALNDRLVEMVKATGEKPTLQPINTAGIFIPGQTVGEVADDQPTIWIPGA